MKVLLTDYINWFSVNHVISDLDSYHDGVIVAPIGSDYLIRLGKVKE